jgi:hypothetical protein
LTVTLLAVGSQPQPLTTNKALKGANVHLQCDPANTHVMYVGAFQNAGNTAALSSSDYGVILPAPVTSIPAAPYPIDPFHPNRELELSSIFLVGTEGEKLHVSYWTP